MAEPVSTKNTTLVSCGEETRDSTVKMPQQELSPCGFAAKTEGDISFLIEPESWSVGDNHHNISRPYCQNERGRCNVYR